MVSKRTVGLLAGVVLILVIVIAVLAVSNWTWPGSQEETSPELPTRESAIPSDAVKVTPETDLFPPILNSDEWMQPVPLPSAINTAGGEDSPFITPDGNTLYFFFTPNVTVPPQKQLSDGITGIYVSTRQNGAWSTAQRVILENHGTLALDGAPFVQGNVMWFASTREGYTGVNLFTAEYANGKWGNWQYAGDTLNKDYQAGEMCLTPDGNEMYFGSSRNGGKGGMDIWVTQKVNGQWQEPENVAAVNTQGNESLPFITPNGNELWFTRTYIGSPAIYRSTKAGDNWSTPQLIVSQFAGEPSLDNNGNLYFVHHFFDNKGNMIEADIYVAYHK